MKSPQKEQKVIIEKVIIIKIENQYSGRWKILEYIVILLQIIIGIIQIIKGIYSL